MTDDHSAPSAFVAAWISQLAARNSQLAGPDSRLGARGSRLDERRWALDVAMGRGRHARLLAREGFVTFGVDVKCDAVRDAVAAAAKEGLSIRGWCADLTVSGLPASAFDVVIVARYLQRDLFEGLKAAVKPGGCVIYETFTTAQLSHAAGPKSPDHLLQPGELRSKFDGWNVFFYEEVDAGEAVARLVAERSLSD